MLARQSLGKGQTLVTVRLDDRVVLLGVTAQSITTLSELDPTVYGIVPGSGRHRHEVLELEAVTSDHSDPSSGTESELEPRSDPESDSESDV